MTDTRSQLLIAALVLLLGAPSRTRLSKTWPMPGGRSATRRTFSSSASISTVGSRSRPPTRGAGERPCDASPKPAARGRRLPNPWSSAHRQACERSTRSAARGGAPPRRASAPIVRPLPLGAAHLARLAGWHRTDRGRHGAPGLRPSAHALRRSRLARDVLHDRHGTLADERARRRLGGDAVARDAAWSFGWTPALRFNLGEREVPVSFALSAV